MKKFLAFFISLLFSFFWMSHLSATVKAPGTYYVLAPSGLNLRVSAEPASDRITTIPYGTRVELTASAKDQNMQVDQLPGGMAKVTYGKLEGYVFDGYLSRFPAPVKKESTEQYVQRIRDARQGAMYEKCSRDWDGYYQEEEAITIYLEDWAEAFLLAQRLFEIPEKLLFPQLSASESESFSNPDKEEEVWEDNLTVRRDEQGLIIGINYFYRREGGGRTVNISPAPDQNGLRLSLTLIAD